MIGALMRMPVDAILGRILAGLHDAGFTDIVSAHLSVLRYPGPDNRRPSELAAETRMSKQAMNYLLGQLEQLGYLIREDDPDDQRSKRIQLTARGEAVRRTIRRTVRQIESDLARELGREQLEQLRELLIALNDTDFVRAPRGLR
jgi:DNA-binding MarR family transcriptional regulator